MFAFLFPFSFRLVSRGPGVSFSFLHVACVCTAIVDYGKDTYILLLGNRVSFKYPLYFISV